MRQIKPYRITFRHAYGLAIAIVTADTQQEAKEMLIHQLQQDDIAIEIQHVEVVVEKEVALIWNQRAY